jgi:predicted transcriptional regulator
VPPATGTQAPRATTPLPEGLSAPGFSGMQVKDVMTSPAVTVGPGTSCREAVQLLADHGIGALPVVDGGQLVGIVSEAGLLSLETRPDPDTPAQPSPERVHQVMTTEVSAVEHDAGIPLVAQLMLQMVVRRLPVLEDGRVVGVVSRRDMIQLLARSDEELEQRVPELVAGEGLAPSGVRVRGGVAELSGGDRDTLRRAGELARGEPGVFDVRVTVR